MKSSESTDRVKSKIKRGDRVVIITGKDKGREGKILLVDRKNGRVIVENANMVVRHQKKNAQSPQGGIINKEASISISNVMFVHKGKPTRVGFKVERKEVNGKMVNVKYRIAKSTGEVID